MQVPFDSRLKNKTNVVAVETRPYFEYSIKKNGNKEESIPMGQPSHWNQNAEVYMEIGISLADAWKTLQSSNSNKTLIRSKGRQVRYEAEIQDCKNTCELKSIQEKGSLVKGYTGGGYFNLESGSSVTWNNVNVSEAGSYKLKFKIYSESMNTIPNDVQVTVNNRTYSGGDLKIVGVDDITNEFLWHEWKKYLQVEVNLDRGDNSVEFELTDGKNLGLDFMRVD